MTDKLEKALVHRPTTGLVGSDRRTSPVIARMTQDVLARAQASGLSRARFRIGDYLLREPDYRQILLWADALGMGPESVLAELAGTRMEPEEDWEKFQTISFIVEDGAILSLVWDFNRLPLIPTSWMPGLQIQMLGFRNDWGDDTIDKLNSSFYRLQPKLPQLQYIYCQRLGLFLIDLSQVPKLSQIYCWDNNLTKLDLTLVPELTRLECALNQITELNLPPTCRLTHLSCWENDLTELELSSMPSLTVLDCTGNRLTNLDLSPVSGLTKLNCMGNDLANLDLAPVPHLSELDCSANYFLTTLDLSPVPQLINLRCGEDVRLLNPPPNLRVYRG